jgi:hypothetical protein
MDAKERKQHEKRLAREELTVALLSGMNKSLKNFKSSIEGYKPTKKDIDAILIKIIERRINR